jgi:NHLM bacteriocin system ABC transporter peptidase/ATP-binding protein
MEAAECGAACLGAVLAYFGRWVSMESLRTACGVNRDGASAADIVTAGKDYGLRITGWRKEVRELVDMPMPAILFWEFNHFVVLEGITRGRFYINDPANGRRWVGDETFDQSFTGIVLQVERTPEFRTGGTAPGVVRSLWPWLRDVKAPLAFVALCGFLLALPGLAVPILLSLFIDHALASPERSWGLTLTVSVMLAAGLVFVLTWLQQTTLRRLAIRLSVVHAERLLSRLLRLPAQYFSHRFAGDLASRVQLIDSIGGNSARQCVGVMIELVMSVLFVALMLFYDPLLAAVVATLASVQVGLMLVLSRLRADETHQVRREQALLFGIGTSGLRSMDNLRATASEDDFFGRWAGYQAKELVARQRFMELGYVITALPRLFLFLGLAAVLGLGGWRVMSGDMSLGVLMGFYVVAGNFLLPIGRFVQFADSFQMLEADLQRVEDVMDAEEDPALRGQDESNSTTVATLNGMLRLAGRVELRNVTFGYQTNRPPLIENLNLIIEPGQRVAIIGPTGSGKSTLLKLATGEYAPWAGEILFDNVPIGEVPRAVLTSSLAAVDQHIFLFAASVRDNITLWNPAVPDHQLVAACNDTLIHDEIMSRPSGYESLLQEGGRNLSGGERQRLEISRALVNNPSVLILDEATSTLDALTEVHIDDALRRRGCTCLIVAHRLSTIRDCDLILVMNQGREVQRGIHDTLIKDPNGLYAELVQAH